MTAPVKQALLRALETVPGVRTQRAALLSRHSWFRIGGPADLLVEPETPEAAAAVFSLLHGQQQVPWLIIGDGSNLLFDDAGLQGVVVRIGRAMARIEVAQTRLTAQGGAWTPYVALAAGRAGLSGIEHVVGIPGTFGGLVMMNGGSLRRSVGTHLDWIDWLSEDGTLRRIPASEAGFAYRRSALQDRRGAILAAGLTLEPADRATVQAEMRTILRNRRAKFPLKLPNCGSVFLSSPELYETIGPPGQAIEEAGLRGLRRGAAQIAAVHGNFIVNHGDARAADVLALIAIARRAVQARTGIRMDAEVRHVRPDGTIVPAHVSADALPADLSAAP
jgi:UDP-N-acetylmuramate dehydrogenase